MDGTSWQDCAISWRPPTVDVQIVRIRHGSGSLGRSLRMLSDSERRRADTFLVEDRARQFVRTRAVLRCLVGESCGARPEAVRIETGLHGKPQLTGEADGGQTCLSVSHSGKLSLIALASGRELGVDLEEANGRTDIQAVAQRFFPKEETDLLRRLSDESERRRVFYGLWTRREALAKALGTGLGDGVFREALGRPRKGLQVVQIGQTSWSLRAMNVARGFAAALALEGSTEPSLTYWDASTLVD